MMRFEGMSLRMDVWLDFFLWKGAEWIYVCSRLLLWGFLWHTLPWYILLRFVFFLNMFAIFGNLTGLRLPVILLLTWRRFMSLFNRFFLMHISKIYFLKVFSSQVTTMPLGAVLYFFVYLTRFLFYIILRHFLVSWRANLIIMLLSNNILVVLYTIGTTLLVERGCLSY